ncbi:MAG: ModE family transcriptional regulator [Erysipelotrichaceae bacterium]|nr:ModE family transcriptional regulator [Erysipelotrichaceae bacterium]
MKVKVFNEIPSFGKGVIELLEGVETYGSLSGSYTNMGMSSSKAWKILKRAQDDLNVTLLTTYSGGTTGGYSVLTEEAKDLIRTYKRMMEDIERYSQEAFGRYFGDDNG